MRLSAAEGYRWSGRWTLGTWPAATEPWLADLYARNPHATIADAYALLWERGYRPQGWDRGRNVTCTVGKNVLTALLVGGSTTAAAGLVGVQYVAVGNGSGNAGKADTALFAEVSRLAPASTSRNTSAGSCEIDAFWGTAQANDTLTEVGCFGGGTATSSSGTGVLFNHYATSQVKTSQNTLTAACQFSF